MDPALRMLLTEMKKDMREMDEKIDQLLAFKWKVLGGTAVVSLIFGIAIQITIAIIGGN